MTDESILARLEALEIETAAISACLIALRMRIGPEFLDMAAEIVQATGAHPESGSAVSKRMTETIRVIDQIRGGRDRKPEAGKIV